MPQVGSLIIRYFSGDRIACLASHNIKGVDGIPSLQFPGFLLHVSSGSWGTFSEISAGGPPGPQGSAKKEDSGFSKKVSPLLS